MSHRWSGSVVILCLIALLSDNGFCLYDSWMDLMTRCEECYYFPDTKDPDMYGQRGDACRHFIYGSKGHQNVYGLTSSIPEHRCRYVVSLKAYTPTCDTFDRQPFNDRLCEYAFRNGIQSDLILVTVAHRYQMQGCEPNDNRNPPFDVEKYQKEFYKDPVREGTCNVWDENVAFTLSSDRIRGLTPAQIAQQGLIFYVCTNEGVLAFPSVNGYAKSGTMINGHFRATSPMNRITLASPYADGPPGVLWQHVTKPPEERVIICSFIISTESHSFRTSSWYVELDTSGRQVLRHHLLPGTLRPEAIHFNSNYRWYMLVGEAGIKRYYYHDVSRNQFKRMEHEEREAGLEFKEDQWNLPPTHPIISLFLPDRVFTNTITKLRIHDIHQSQENIRLLDLKPTYQNSALPPINATYNADILAKIDAIYVSCRDGRVLCFVFPWEEGCQSREKCHILVSVEELYDFERLHFDIVIHPRPPHSIVRPYTYGWAAFAFSVDAKMGGEAVFTCSYRGRAGKCADMHILGKPGVKQECAKIYISLNLEHPKLMGSEKNNFYAGDDIDPEFGDYQQLIENPIVDYAEVPSESQPRILCSFDVQTSDYRNISQFPKRPKSILQYDLMTEEYYVLLATGKTIVGNWQISYHGVENRAAGSTLKFSKKIYYEATRKFREQQLLSEHGH